MEGGSYIEDHISMDLSKEQCAFCKSVSYLFWWKRPNELVARPHRALAGVMDRGGVAEWAEMERIFPREFIVHAIETAVCGEFHGWSWKFWRMRYGLDADAPLPSRLPGTAPPAGDYWFTGLQRHKAVSDDEYERLKWTYSVRGIDVPDAI